jgi:hypothetical protein
MLKTELMLNLSHILLVPLLRLTQFILEAFNLFFLFNSFFSHSVLELLLLDLHALKITVTFISNANFKFFFLTLIALFEL